MDVLVGDLLRIGREEYRVWMGIDLKRTDGLTYMSDQQRV